MKKIFVFTGPESSGKTTLAERLSADLNLPIVPEFARQYLENKGGKYALEEVDYMAQIQKELEADAPGNRVICDTDLLTFYIWKKEVFVVDDVSLLQELKKTPRHYLLCKPNIPWIQDPLRENPLDRDRLFSLYLEVIEGSNIPFSIIDGDGFKDRYLQALSYINQLLKTLSPL